jgi:hypothetical protein
MLFATRRLNGAMTATATGVTVAALMLAVGGSSAMADRCYAANGRSVRCPPDTVPPPRPVATVEFLQQQRTPFLQPLRGGDPEDAELLRRHADGLRNNSLIQNEEEGPKR